jgi:hypothetical protein
MLAASIGAVHAQEQDMLEVLMSKGSKVLAAPQGSVMITPQAVRSTSEGDRYFVPGIFRSRKPKAALVADWRVEVAQICQRDFRTNLKHLLRPSADLPPTKSDYDVDLPSFGVGLDVPFFSSKLEGGNTIKYKQLFLRVPNYNSDIPPRMRETVTGEILAYLQNMPLRNWKTGDRRHLNCAELVRRHLYDGKITFIGTGLVVARGYAESNKRRISQGVKLKYGPISGGPQMSLPLGSSGTDEGDTIVGIMPASLEENRHAIARNDLRKHTVAQATPDDEGPGMLQAFAEYTARRIAPIVPPY